MQINPYQKIVKNGKVIQPGHIDTEAKFLQLTGDLDLHGKTVLDVGCNVGMMCQLAYERGAKPLGIDINIDYIKQAREMFPGIQFDCRPVEMAVGDYDVIIASAMLHYVPDLSKVLNQLARCGKVVVCDVWLSDNNDTGFHYTIRELFIPTRWAFEHIAGRFFNSVEIRGLTLSPDGSDRYLYTLSTPNPITQKAVLIYGDGGVGKSTLAQSYGYEILQTDSIFVEWKVIHSHMSMSVMWSANAIRGKYKKDYVKYYVEYIKNWMRYQKNLDVVIEGYDLSFKDIREPVISHLEELGYGVEVAKL